MNITDQIRLMRRLAELKAPHFAEGRLPQGNGKVSLRLQDDEIGNRIFTLAVERVDAAPLPDDVAAIGQAAGAPAGVEWTWHSAKTHKAGVGGTNDVPNHK